MPIQTFYSYKKLYEDFFDASFKRVPKHNLVEEYDLIEGKVRIERNANHWYFYTPEDLSEWELFILIEARKQAPKTISELSVLITTLASRKGMKLTVNRKDMLIHLYQQVNHGYGILDRIWKDNNVAGVKLVCLNTLCTLSIIHKKYGECQTNIGPTADLVKRILTRLKKAGCPDDGTCLTRIAELSAHATVLRKETATLQTVRILIEKTKDRQD